jgi:hypothetical protein
MANSEKLRKYYKLLEEKCAEANFFLGNFKKLIVKNTPGL